ncbi:universal stress protein [Halomarina pelagica]|uniref:universal stress protein n=1 Tax=Halomarina pelagica TaxID=2961599 RepID=UPI0020C4A905|nr:universal stress protein [Halomarina sp. BND7]
MTERILVPMDGSPLSVRALELALAERGDVTVLHVIDPTEPGYSYYGEDVDLREEPRHGSEAWYERADAYERELFETAREVAADHDSGIETASVVGRPSREIVDYAVANGVDHVVMGSHGRDLDTHVALGSVTEAVAFRAPVRVTLVR